MSQQRSRRSAFALFAIVIFASGFNWTAAKLTLESITTGKATMTPGESADHIVVFQEQAIRRVWHNHEWWFSVMDVCGVLTESADPGASQFYRLLPNVDSVRLNLSWTHYRHLLRLDDPGAREWYANEAATQNWSTRQLERQIGTLYYERLLASKDRKRVAKEAGKNLAHMDETPRDFVRDPVMLEFRSMPHT